MALESNLIFEKYRLINEVSLSRGNIERLTKKFNINDVQAKVLINRFNQVVKRLHNKDIFSYNTVRELLDTTEAARIAPSRTEHKTLIKAEGAQKVFENDKCLVLMIRSPEAAMIYGRGTKWCIAALYDNQFGNYTVYDVYQSTVYFIINKQVPTNKYAVLICRPIGDQEDSIEEIRDETNQELTLNPEFRRMQLPQVLDALRGKFQIPDIFKSVPYTQKEREAVKRVSSIINQRELEQHLNRMFGVTPQR